MLNFKIIVKADISKIKSVFSNSIEDMDLLACLYENSFQKKKYKRRFVGRSNGRNLKLSVIYYQSYLSSPILKGEIQELDDHLKSINFSFTLHPLSLVFLPIFLIFIIFLVINLFKLKSLLSALIVLTILILGLIFFISNFNSKLKALRYFVNKIFRDLSV